MKLSLKMANKNRKPRNSPKKSRKPRKARKAAAPPPKRRVRRLPKATQVTGDEIDIALEDLVNKTPLERKIEAKIAADEETHQNLLISTNYEESSPFDPDEDIDCEPENRNKMYEVPPKARSPEPGNSSTVEPIESPVPQLDVQDLMLTAANRAYEYYFN